MGNTVDTSLTLTDYQNENRRQRSDLLGKDDFLKIFMVQLQNQDPMNPMQDKDFIAQMAAFSTLEQITNMGKTMETFTKTQQQSQLIFYNQFIGKEITWQRLVEPDDPETPGGIEEGSGRVVSIQFKDDNAIFILEDGTKIKPENISEIGETSKESYIAQASMMIGKRVFYLTHNNEEEFATIESVTFKEGNTLFHLHDKNVITASQISKIE